jgi:5-formyltetrahydrofolate cyclo-ligase
MTAPDNLSSWRKAERTRLLALRMGAAPDLRRQWNDAVTQHLCVGFPMLSQMVVGFYWPFKAEFDPRFAIRHWRGAGARVALPEVVQKKAPLVYREWWPGVAMQAGVFDLPVPQGTDILIPDAVLIPPVGFDAQGYRLGYGGGYFDRTLAAMRPQPIKIGVAFELCRIPTIQPQPYDMAMDFIATEAGVYAAGSGRLELVRDQKQIADWVRSRC